MPQIESQTDLGYKCVACGESVDSFKAPLNGYQCPSCKGALIPVEGNGTPSQS